VQSEKKKERNKTGGRGGEKVNGSKEEQSNAEGEGRLEGRE